MDLKPTILKILENTHLMSLATVDEIGPWVSDVIFIYDEDLTIYWMSDPDTRHSKAIEKNNKVAGTITYTAKSKEPNMGIQFSGIASKIEGARYDLAQKHFKKRNKPEPKETDDVLEGDSWYMIKLNTMDVIDESQWGFKKQKMEL